MCEIGSGQAAAAPRCDSTLEGSVGMEGWRISCWPQDSQFAYAPGSSGIMAVTTTNTTKANDWVSLSVSLLDTTTSKVAPVATATAFQPLFSPDGKQLAYTIADDKDYVWSQCCKYTSNPPFLVISGSILRDCLCLQGTSAWSTPPKPWLDSRRQTQSAIPTAPVSTQATYRCVWLVVDPF